MKSQIKKIFLVLLLCNSAYQPTICLTYIPSWFQPSAGLNWQNLSSYTNPRQFSARTWATLATLGSLGGGLWYYWNYLKPQWDAAKKQRTEPVKTNKEPVKTNKEQEKTNKEQEKEQDINIDYINNELDNIKNMLNLQKNSDLPSLLNNIFLRLTRQVSKGNATNTESEVERAKNNMLTYLKNDKFNNLRLSEITGLYYIKKEKENILSLIETAQQLNTNLYNNTNIARQINNIESAINSIDINQIDLQINFLDSIKSFVENINNNMNTIRKINEDLQKEKDKKEQPTKHSQVPYVSSNDDIWDKYHINKKYRDISPTISNSLAALGQNETEFVLNLVALLNQEAINTKNMRVNTKQHMLYLKTVYNAPGHDLKKVIQDNNGAADQWPEKVKKDLTSSYKIHLMPTKDEFIALILKIAQELQNPQKSALSNIENAKIRIPYIEKDLNPEIPDEMRIAGIILYVYQDAQGTQDVLNELFERLTNFKGSGLAPRYNAQINDLIYVAQGDADYKKDGNLKKYFEEPNLIYYNNKIFGESEKNYYLKYPDEPKYYAITPKRNPSSSLSSSSSSSSSSSKINSHPNNNEHTEIERAILLIKNDLNLASSEKLPTELNTVFYNGSTVNDLRNIKNVMLESLNDESLTDLNLADIALLYYIQQIKNTINNAKNHLNQNIPDNIKTILANNTNPINTININKELLNNKKSVIEIIKKGKDTILLGYTAQDIYELKNYFKLNNTESLPTIFNDIFKKLNHDISEGSILNIKNERRNVINTMLEYLENNNLINLSFKNVALLYYIKKQKEETLNFIKKVKDAKNVTLSNNIYEILSNVEKDMNSINVDTNLLNDASNTIKKINENINRIYQIKLDKEEEKEEEIKPNKETNNPLSNITFLDVQHTILPEEKDKIKQEINKIKKKYEKKIPDTQIRKIEEKLNSPNVTLVDLNHIKNFLPLIEDYIQNQLKNTNTFTEPLRFITKERIEEEFESTLQKIIGQDNIEKSPDSASIYRNFNIDKFKEEISSMIKNQKINKDNFNFLVKYYPIPLINHLYRSIKSYEEQYYSFESEKIQSTLKIYLKRIYQLLK